jgi:hypothetical protein
MEITIDQRIHELIDLIPEHSKPVILDIISHYIPDDMATPEDIRDIEEAREEYRRGEAVSIEDVMAKLYSL